MGAGGLGGEGVLVVSHFFFGTPDEVKFNERGTYRSGLYDITYRLPNNLLGESNTQGLKDTVGKKRKTSIRLRVVFFPCSRSPSSALSHVCFFVGRVPLLK